MTKSNWSHIGIVLRDPTYIDPCLTGLYLWESGQEDRPDVEDDIRKFGVQISDLREVVEGYSGRVVTRKLEARIENLGEKLKVLHAIVHDDKYDLNLYDLLSARMNITYKPELSRFCLINYFKPNHRRANRFFCSAFVAFVYTDLGLLPKDTEWTECVPKWFSSENPNLEKIMINSRLGEEAVLK